MNEERLPYPALYCYECDKLLRTVEGKELCEIHTASNMEDVCEDCCDVCAAEEVDGMDLEDALDVLMK